MALVVEDGTGLAAANSYASLAEALAYHADRGNSAWAASTDDLRSAALIRATVALDGLYSNRWPGFRYLETQGLAWPRSYATDVDGYDISTEIPTALKNATCEAALVELDSAGALSKKAMVGLAERTVGPITEKWRGASGAAATAYPAIGQALARIVKAGSANIAIVRG